MSSAIALKDTNDYSRPRNDRQRKDRVGHVSLPFRSQSLAGEPGDGPLSEHQRFDRRDLEAISPRARLVGMVDVQVGDQVSRKEAAQARLIDSLLLRKSHRSPRVTLRGASLRVLAAIRNPDSGKRADERLLINELRDCSNHVILSILPRFLSSLSLVSDIQMGLLRNIFGAFAL